MPQFEFEFSNQDKDLVVSQDSATFSGFDYIRLTIYPTEAIDNIVTLQDGSQAIFYSSLNSEPYNINISPFGASLNEILTKTIGGSGNNDFQIYSNETNQNIYIKPNEIFNEFELPQGDYKIQIDFLNQLNPPQDNELEFYEFIVKQISTSRKEVRLKLLNQNILNNSDIITNITNQLNNFELEFLDELDEQGNPLPNPNYKYQFKHFLNIGTGDHNPIMNYTFDKVTDGTNNQSLILKLYDELPLTINNLSHVTIEKEVITTQIEDIFYFSEVPDVFFGDGLQPDPQENWINDDGNEIGFQSFNQLSSSMDIITLDGLISESLYNYPNLNTDFTSFANHTFFGSAKKKLENFKTKVETIQGHYSKISQSLNSVGQIVDSSSKFIIQKREDLFKKINDEIKTFTPYERFLYFDGQSETTASAPGLGKNYADIVPVAENFGSRIGEIKDYLGTLNNSDGFPVVYHHSSKLNGKNTNLNLFSGKYIAHNKPFFNYGGNIYLSFLMKGDSGSALTWENRNSQDYGGGVRFPEDSLYQETIQQPDITGSEYRRYIFKASQSYWIPTVFDGFDFSQLEIGDFQSASTRIEILSGSIKTGSHNFENFKTGSVVDSSGKYDNYLTALSGSLGHPTVASCMPAGELFRIFSENSLSQSLQGYWNIDDVTSGSSLSLANVVNDAGPTTGDATDILGVTASAGVEVHGRQYGSSYFMISESGFDTGVHFDSTDFNFNKDDNFSLSVWVKRFHPNTGSADPTVPSSTTAQGILIRGNAENSYGIEYRHSSNQFRCGVRPTSDGNTKRLASHTMTDDGLNWHHVVMTYESASATGIKLYVDGVLEANTTNVTDGTGATMGDFSASNANADVGEKLSLGGDDILAGSRGVFNGFLQYPRVYNRAISAEEVNLLYLNPPGITQTKITDVKVSLNDPTFVLPFDNLYQTSSTAWTDWYNGMHDSASTFDTNNIHSFENNLPLYIQESSEYNDMKDFLALQGEQYDLIKNHIDSLGTFHNRGYKENNSPSENILPMLLSNMGWQAINPFTGSLSETLGNYLTGVTSIDDIKNNTWRKTLNNLLYIYKSKGTQNSVRALLNVYGYPPDVIKFQEFGGSTVPVGGEAVDSDLGGIFDEPILNDIPPNIDEGVTSYDIDLNLQNANFIKTPNLFYRYLFNAIPDRVLNLDWWMDDANINTIEFVYRHTEGRYEQTLLKSSGSGNETLWDLRLVPSSDGASSSFEFRLNNSQVADSNIGERGFSMSLAYNKFEIGELWNVMLQRMTSSISGAGIQEYRLHAARQGKDGVYGQGSRPEIGSEVIEKYNYVSMSISGGLTGGSTLGGKGFFANQNFQSSGSRHADSSSNLFVGEIFSGSLAEIKAWNSALSISRFRQHTFNKFSTAGNSINSHERELIYHFRLNENYTTSSISSSNQVTNIIDSAPKCFLTRDYTLTQSADFFTGSIVYGLSLVNSVRFVEQDNLQKVNDNNIIINPNRKPIGNLSSNNVAIEPFLNNTTSPLNKPKIITSPKLEIYKSPQDFVNNFIYDKLSGFNFENLYGSPTYYYSSSYDELDDFREEFFKCHPIEVNTNKFIRANEGIFNHSLAEGLKAIVPARSTFSDKNSNIGVEIKQTILERQKYENEKHDIEVNPNTASGSINIISIKKTILSSSGTPLRFDDTAGINLSKSKLEQFFTGSINLYDTSNPKINKTTGSYNQFISLTGSNIITPHETSLNIYDSTKPMVNKTTGSRYPLISFTGSGVINPHTFSINMLPSYNGSTVVLSKDGTIDYSSTLNKSYASVHKNWGRGDNSVHFLNYAARTGSDLGSFPSVNNDYNVNHIDTRFHFYSIGDTEYYSASKGKASRFDDSSRFYNRLMIDTDFHANVTYKSLIGGVGVDSNQTGRMVGKTRYFITSSDGSITFPSNHVTKFSQPFKEQMNNGAQNTNPGFLNVRYEDYSTSSFYRVKVTGGENQIIIKGGDSELDSNDRIIY